MADEPGAGGGIASPTGTTVKGNSAWWAAVSRPTVGLPRSGRAYPTKPSGIASAMAS